MIRFLFFLIIVLSSCSKLDDLPIDKLEDNPIFTVNMTVNGDSLTLGAGIEDYFMFAQSDIIGSLRVNRGLLAPSNGTSPLLQSALVINIIGQDINSGNYVYPKIGELDLFDSDTIPFWELSVQASLFGNFPSTNMKFFIDGEEKTYSSETRYLIEQKAENRVELVKELEGKKYYYNVTAKGDGLKNLGTENLHIFYEGEDSSNSKIVLQSNFDNITSSVLFPDGSLYDFESSIAIDQLGEYKLSVVDVDSETIVEANFYITQDEEDKWVSSRINFTGSNEYLGMIEALNSTYIEYYDENGKYFNSILRASQPASSYFRIKEIESFLPNVDNEPTDKVSFSTQLMLQSEDNETLLFSGSGIIAIGN